MSDKIDTPVEAHHIPALVPDDNAGQEPYQVVAAQSGDPVVAAVLAGKDIQVDVIEKLQELQIKYDAHEAFKAFHRDMAGFRAEAPIIEKDTAVDFNQTHYKHATLGGALEKINPILAKYNLNPSWETTQEGADITVTCTLTHALGHSEHDQMTARPDDTGNKNAIQQVASTVSYLRRYTLFGILGLASKDMDDDGRGSDAEVPRLSKDQQNTIVAIIDDNELDKKIFNKFIKNNSMIRKEKLEDVPAVAYDMILNKLKTAVKNKEQEKAAK